MAHPPRSNPPLRSSSGPPSPCILPSTETFVLVVSFMVPFLSLVVLFLPRAYGGGPKKQLSSYSEHADATPSGGPSATSARVVDELRRTHILGGSVNEGSPKLRMVSRVGRRDLLKVQTPCAAIWRARRRPRDPEGEPRGPPALGRAAGRRESPSPAQPRCRRGTWDPLCRV